MSGLTFFEMLVTLSIMAIFAVLGVPAWQIFIDRSHDKMMQDQLLQAIQFARHEALAKGISIALCKSVDRAHCSKDSANSLLIFINKDNNGVIHNKGQILAMMTLPEMGLLEWRSFPYYRHYLSFLPTHVINYSNDNASIWYCRQGGTLPVWAIILSKTGRVRTIYPDKQGEIKDTVGHALKCAVRNNNK